MSIWVYSFAEERPRHGWVEQTGVGVWRAGAKLRFQLDDSGLQRERL